jgi:hypothetical protein
LIRVPSFDVSLQPRRLTMKKMIRIIFVIIDLLTALREVCRKKPLD